MPLVIIPWEVTSAPVMKVSMVMEELVVKVRFYFDINKALNQYTITNRNILLFAMTSQSEIITCEWE